MEKIVDRILVKVDQETAYDTYSNILLWKDILDNVVDIQIISVCDDSQEFYYTIQKGDITETVRTVRKLYPPYKIEMEQTVTPPGFKSMKGIWNFDRTQQGTLITATRIVELEETVNAEQTLKLLGKMLRYNLEAFKKYMEVHKFCVSQIIPAPIDLVYELFWNIKEWQHIWNPITNVKIISQAGKYQVFQMDVNMNNTMEQIETKRIREDNSITFCSTRPISTFEMHKGRWIFAKTEENHTKVTAVRIFKFRDDFPMDGRAEYSAKFQNRVDTILLKFRDYFARLN